MSFGAEIWGPPLIAAGANLFSNLGQGTKETKMEKTKRKLVDELLRSITGEGAYSDIFGTGVEGFNKSFVEPAQARFRNQIAPGIQQQYIASGQQRGTGLDDQLLRAGVDLDEMLNQQFFNYQQNALGRKQQAINAALGQGAGAPNQTTAVQDIFSGLGGALSNPSYQENALSYIFGNNQPSSPAPAPQAMEPRKGFAPDWMSYQLGDKRWGLR